MTFSQAIQSGFRNYAEFRGRASRPEFWWWILFAALVNAVLGAIPTWTIALANGVVGYGPTLSGVWSLVVLLPTLGLTVRRLRDAGSEWGHVFWLLLPVAGLIILAVLCAQPTRQPLPVEQPAVVPTAGSAPR